MKDFADSESGAILYLNGKDTDRFVDELDAMVDLVGYVGMLTYAETLGLILRDLEVNYWDVNTIHDTIETNAYYKDFDSNSRAIIDPCSILMKEVAERSYSIFDQVDELCLVVKTTTLNLQKKKFVIRGSYGQDPQMIIAEIVNSFKELEDWIFANMTNRTYNLGDNRHIENHPDYRKGKSPLLGGLGGKANAQALLSKALGDQRDRSFLINYDGGNNRYIRYEFEGNNPQNGYHGYHLAKPKTYISDELAIKNIPIRIIKLLEYRLQLENNA